MTSLRELHRRHDYLESLLRKHHTQELSDELTQLEQTIWQRSPWAKTPYEAIYNYKPSKKGSNMARRNRYYKRTRRGARRGYKTARRAYRKSGIRITKDPFYWGAAIVGATTNLDDKIPAAWKMVLATMPVSGPGISQVKHMAQGLVFGDAIDTLAQGKLRVIGRGDISSNLYR